jgi:hypothetical protein
VTTGLVGQAANAARQKAARSLSLDEGQVSALDQPCLPRKQQSNRWPRTQHRAPVKDLPPVAKML